MFATLLTLALAGLSSVESRPIPHSVRLYRRAGLIPASGYPKDRQAPTSWAFELLEPYNQYHFRYLGVGCAEQHNTTFFNTCCHPRIATKTDADYAYECSLSAHVPAGEAPTLTKQMKVAGAEASQYRQLEIVSISSVSQASINSISSVSAASIESISSVSASAISAESASAASRSAAAASRSAARASRSSAAAATTVAPSTSSDAASKSSAAPESRSSDAGAAAASRSSAAAAAAASQSSAAAAAAAASKSSADAQAPSPTSSAAPAPSSSGGGSDGSGSGGDSGGNWMTDAFGTFYYQAGTIGACGLQSSPVSDYSKVIAQRYDLYDNGANCGRNIEITNLDTGATAVGMVNDECMGCATTNSLDMSLGLFEELASFSTGEIPIRWRYVD